MSVQIQPASLSNLSDRLASHVTCDVVCKLYAIAVPDSLNAIDFINAFKTHLDTSQPQKSIKNRIAVMTAKVSHCFIKSLILNVANQVHQFVIDQIGNFRSQESDNDQFLVYLDRVMTRLQQPADYPAYQVGLTRYLIDQFYVKPTRSFESKLRNIIEKMDRALDSAEANRFKKIILGFIKFGLSVLLYGLVIPLGYLLNWASHRITLLFKQRIEKSIKDLITQLFSNRQMIKTVIFESIVGESVEHSTELSERQKTSLTAITQKFLEYVQLYPSIKAPQLLEKILRSCIHRMYSLSQNTAYLLEQYNFLLCKGIAQLATIGSAQEAGAPSPKEAFDAAFSEVEKMLTPTCPAVIKTPAAIKTIGSKLKSVVTGISAIAPVQKFASFFSSLSPFAAPLVDVCGQFGSFNPPRALGRKLATVLESKIDHVIDQHSLILNVAMHIFLTEFNPSSARA
jgi:hypothetical protein